MWGEKGSGGNFNCGHWCEVGLSCGGNYVAAFVL